jgi:DHA2 family multidrug resistance protein-like MFS transporter
METEKLSLKKYTAVIAILIVLVMTVLDVTVVNVALPVLATKFGISDSLTVWIVTIYQLLITMLILPLSSVGDLFSYRRTFLTGVVIFTLASAMCAASWNFTAILVSRAIQGIGAACVMSVNIALTRLIYPRKVLGRGLALNGMVVASATAAGPTIAGALLSIASWHWLFLINVPFGVAAFLLGKKYLPQNPKKEHRTKYDMVSAVENILMFGLLFLALGGYTGRSDEPRLFILLGCAAVVAIFYIRRELHRSDPMLPVDLFKIRLYTLSVITSVCSFIAQMLAMVALPFILLNSYGFSSIVTGLLMTPWPLATMIVSPLAARFVEKHNAGVTAAVGMAVFACGLFLMILMPESGVSAWGIIWRMTVCGIGYGLFQTPNNIVMVTATPINRTGGAGGMQSTARLVGQTLGATLVTIVFAVFAATTYELVHICLWISLSFALVAGIFSLSRKSKVTPIAQVKG